MNGRIIITPIVLNSIFIIAMLKEVFVLKNEIISFISDLKGVINIENNITVEMLNIRLKCASFFASLEEFKIP